MSSDSELTPDLVEMASTELQRLAEELSTIAPPATLRVQHDLLVQAARLGVIATSLRMEAARSGDPAALRNAKSAASGAVLMINRACEGIRCP
jgi:hypothetical protein